MMAPTGNNSIARKRSTDAKGSGFSSASNTSLGSFKRNGDGKTLHDVRVSSRKPLSRNASLTIGDAEQINGRSGRQSSFAQDTYVRTCSHALEDALLSFHDLKLSQGKEKDALSNYLPLVTIGDSIVCLARDERLIEEVKRRKVLKRMRDAESFSKDHYKYSLFAGEDPMEEELPQHLELTPQEHIEIARNSITGNELGIHNMRSLVSKRLNRDYSKGNCNRMEKVRRRKWSHSDKLVFCVTPTGMPLFALVALLVLQILTQRKKKTPSLFAPCALTCSFSSNSKSPSDMIQKAARSCSTQIGPRSSFQSLTLAPCQTSGNRGCTTSRWSRAT